MAKMKDSGVEWIGEIPEGWEVCKLKYCLLDKMQYGANSSGITFQPELPRYIRITDIKNNYELFSEEKLSLPENETAEFLLENGDLLFARSGATVGKTFLYRKAIGKAGFAGYLIKAKCNTEKLIPDFLCYFTQCSSYDSWKNQIFIQATIQNIGADKYSNMEIPCPSIQLQQKIATYLDEKCSQIEQTIQNQQQVIEKLKAYKQSLITEAVTGKVKIQNGKVAGKYEQYKDSGVEWIGEIPEEWIVEKSRYAISKIGDIDHDMPESVNNGIPYLKTGDLKEKLSEVDFTDCKKVSMQDFQRLSKKCKANKGDLVFARYATIGTVMYIDCDVDFLISYSCVTVKPDRDILSGKYLFYYFKSKPYFEEINKYINSNTQGNVGIDSMYRAKICIPCLNDQIEIATYLDKTCAAIDSAIEQKQKLIEKLTEYKKSLIYECVTGKKEI